MWLKLLTIIAILSLINGESVNGVSFQNVRVVGSSIKFDKIIVSSNSLKENLPEIEYDELELKNKITILYKDSIVDIDNVKKLVLTSNELQEIQPGAFRNLPKLHTLLITNNKLKEIKAGVFNDLNLRTLNLSFNEIETIEDTAFDNLPQLYGINLDHNKIKYWNKNWFQNTPMASPFMVHNQIEELPDEAFKNLENMASKPTLGVALWFSNNKIKKIGANAFKNLKYIVTLDLDNNEIENVNENWLDGIKIGSLGLDENKVTCLRGDFDKIFTAEFTTIDENPWNCDCLKDVITYSTNHPLKEIDVRLSKLKCHL